MGISRQPAARTRAWKSISFHPLRAGEQRPAFRADREDRGVQAKGDGSGHHPGRPAGGILCPGHLPVENARAKAGMEALGQHAP